jgi:hypothetical protein
MRRRAALAAACAAALAARGRAGEQLMSLSSVTQQDPRAVCNDGSAAGFYYAPATDTGGQQNVWLVMLEGARATRPAVEGTRDAAAAASGSGRVPHAALLCALD